MLGLQETRPAGTPSTKTYSCMACSATFHGLASLLVHQASHASEISSQSKSTSPTCSHCGSLFASNELLEKHQCMVLPPPAPQKVYICECGEEFQEVSAIKEHKRLHEEETLVKTHKTSLVLNNNDSEVNLEVIREYSPCATDEDPLCENSPSHCTGSVQQSTNTTIEAETKDRESTSDKPPAHSSFSEEHQYQKLKPSDLPSFSMLKEAQVQSFQNEPGSVKSEIINVSNSVTKETPKQSQETAAKNKNTLLKLLASAYMNRRHPAQINWEKSKRILPPRKVSPRAPKQTSLSPSSGCSDHQLGQKAAKYGPNRDSFIPSASKQKVNSVKTFSKKTFVSMTKTMCPVVALETHQKLCRDNVESRHQCGLCRRVFQDMDNLIMHHACHMKERVKFCRRCQQFVISENSVPDNHICSRPHSGMSRHFSFVGKEALASNSTAILHPQKLFRCPLCSRSYTRRHTLNKHNCQWITSPKCSSAAQKDARICNFGEAPNAEEQLSSEDEKSASHVHVGVNTEASKNPVLIKTEQLHTVSPIMGEYQMGLMTQSPSIKSGEQLGSAKSFLPFLSSISKCTSELAKDDIEKTLKSESLVGDAVAQVAMKEDSDTEASESSGGEEWTVPLDDAEIDVLIDNDEEHHHLEETPRENSDEDVVSLEPSINSETNTALSGKDFQVHVSDSGIRRFSCNRCQKSYSRRFTLKQHLKICGARKLIDQHSFGKVSAGILGLKKRFPCPHCGTSFTRKDNMNMHRKRCQSVRNANTQMGNRMLDKQNQEPHENMFVLPPVSKNQIRQVGSNNSGGGSWGIMSLPSMLPRKVTCECGASFTCPRLLFEHLQMHALESYICSNCGENLQSWADFEAHQQLHEQPSRQKNEQKGPQHQQLPHAQSKLEQNLKKQPQDLLKPHLNYKHPTDPCVCYRCKKVFRLRSSLLKHLRLDCREDVVAQKKYSCSRCGMTFQSSLAHKVHIQGNTCIPTFKAIRCPVCVRWFSSLDGLKKHLVAHSQQKVLMCQICGHNCSNQQALEEHKKKVHGVNRASESATVQSAHVSQSSLSNAFRCQICHRSYPKIQSLKDHLRKVHKPKGQNLISLHTFEPKAGALESSKGTVQQSQYKQFQCHICARTYPDIQSLKNHRRRVHRILGGGLQPLKGVVQQSHSIQFQCQICSRCYPNVRSLRNHRRRVHRILGGLETFRGIIHQRQDNLFKCQICQRSYPDIKSLKNHRRRVHRILGNVVESTKVATTNMEQSQSEVFHVTAPSEPFEHQ